MINAKFKIAIIICAVALIFTAVICIGASDSRAFANEVTLTIVRNRSTTVSSGTFNSIMTAINSLSTEQTANAEFSIVFNSNASATKYWELRNMSATAKINIDLNGYTLTATNGNVIQMRSSYTLNIDGSDENGNVGKWVST